MHKFSNPGTSWGTESKLGLNRGEVGKICVFNISRHKSETVRVGAKVAIDHHQSQ